MLEDITEEDEEHDFGQGINEHNEFISDDPFMNPVIDGHEWQVNERSKRSFFSFYAKFSENELQSEYFRSKTALAGSQRRIVPARTPVEGDSAPRWVIFLGPHRSPEGHNFSPPVSLFSSLSDNI